jgi:hypothetical protein
MIAMQNSVLGPVSPLFTGKFGLRLGCALFAVALSCFMGSRSAQSADHASAQVVSAATSTTRKTSIDGADIDACGARCVLADGMEDGSVGDTDPATLSATMDWSNLAYVDKGYRSSTAMHYSGLIVEVHDSTGSVYQTGNWYHIGKVNASGTKVNWGPSRHLNCCFAMYPSVAITNEGYVIFSYSTGSNKKDSTLTIMVGTLDVNGGIDQTIEWKTKQAPFDSGYHDTLSVNASGVIAEAHESGSGGKGMYYRLGHLKDPASGDFTIVWDTGDYGQKYADGINPHIAINDNGEVVEVHQASAGDYKLHYIRGKLNANSIEFNKSQPRYNDNGQRPAVALLNDGYLVEVHDNGSSVYYRTGLLDSKDASKIDWSKTQSIPNGKSLESNSVSSNGYYAVATAYDDYYASYSYSVSVAP